MQREKIVDDLCLELEKYQLQSVEDISGVTQQTMNNWLSGRTKKPRIDTLARVARAIGFELYFKRSENLKLAA